MSWDSDNDSEPEAEFKVVVIGKSTVGKTSLITIATSGSPAMDSIPTIGANFSTKLHHYHDKEVIIQIWDTAGHERFRSMTPLYYRGARVILFVFALDSLSSFQEIDDWHKSVIDAVGSSLAMVLVGNKYDLPRQIAHERAANKANELNMRCYMETSAITGFGINELFDTVAEILVTMDEEMTEKRPHIPLSAVDSRKRCC
jgi:small GTP-binding protein